MTIYCLWASSFFLGSGPEGVRVRVRVGVRVRVRVGVRSRVRVGVRVRD